MNKLNSSRLEAFSDGVIAIIITIMVLEMKSPIEDNLNGLFPILPNLFAYILSFIYVSFYWSNHHHLIKAVGKINKKVMWANIHWLFWLSLLPVGTSWISKFYSSRVPVITYSVILLMSAISYRILQTEAINTSKCRDEIRKIIGGDFKGNASIFLYIVAMPIAFLSPYISEFIFLIVALMWSIPDRRIERVISIMGVED